MTHVKAKNLFLLVLLSAPTLSFADTDKFEESLSKVDQANNDLYKSIRFKQISPKQLDQFESEKLGPALRGLNQARDNEVDETLSEFGLKRGEPEREVNRDDEMISKEQIESNMKEMDRKFASDQKANQKESQRIDLETEQEYQPPLIQLDSKDLKPEIEFKSQKSKK